MGTGSGRAVGHSSFEEDFTVHVIDDDGSWRAGLVRWLGARGWRADGYSHVDQFLDSDPDDVPGCIVLGVGLPSTVGLQLLEGLTREHEQLPVIVCSSWVDVPMSVDAMKAGAADFLIKPVAAERLLISVQRVQQPALHRFAERREARLWLARYQELTERERAVFRGIAAGMLNKQVAVQLGACERTVKAERARIMKKLRLTSMVDLVRAAERVGIDLPRMSGVPRSGRRYRATLPRAHS